MDIDFLKLDKLNKIENTLLEILKTLKDAECHKNDENKAYPYIRDPPHYDKKHTEQIIRDKVNNMTTEEAFEKMLNGESFD